MRVLGISAYYHDSAAALIEDGRILAAAQEERFTRIKHDSGFPRNAVAYCLENYPGALDAVVYYEKPLQKFERILSTAFAIAPLGFRAFATAMPLWLQQKLWIPGLVESELQRLGHDVRDRVFFASHHQSHAASAFYPSPFERAAFLTLDGVGEWSTTSFGVGAGKELRTLREMRFPHSLGMLYSAFTYHCGFRVNSGEYKLMGLAPYGEPRFRRLILDKLVDLKADGSFRLDLAYFGYLRGQVMTNERFGQLFEGPARRGDEEVTRWHCDLARSIQVVAEEIVLAIARTVHRETGEKLLCLAGGVALNCVANSRLLREGPFERIWVQPAAGDAGGALGAALAYFHGVSGGPRLVGTGDSMAGGYLGPEYQDAEIEKELLARGLKFRRCEVDEQLDHLVSRLDGGAVVGHFHGRAEFGPRALGNRSILADARSREMQSVLNLKIKFRESFRPFAPIVLKERCSDYFELNAESPYMLFTAPVQVGRRLPGQGDGISLLDHLHAARSDIPAVTHVDYSARVQTVDRQVAPRLHRLLEKFEQRTGCAVLINTSFNVRGEPPVCHPREAIECFLSTGMDTLSIGSFLVEKADQDSAVLAELQPRQFAPD